MRKKRLVNVLTSAALTAALVMSMGMTAMADTGVTGSGTTGVEEISVTKTVTTDGKTYQPNTTFSYTVSGGDAGTYTVTKSDGSGTEDLSVLAGTTGDLTVTNADFTYESTEVLSISSSYLGEAKITFDSTAIAAKTPGIYHYVIYEDEGTYPGVTYDGTVYDIFVYVLNDGTNNYVGYVVVAEQSTVNNTTTRTKSDLTFTNDYGATNNEVKSLTVTKALDGNLQNATDRFKVTVKVSDETITSEQRYQVVVISEGVTTTYDITNGSTTSEIEIVKGATITVNGLTSSAVVTITETNTNGYTATYINVEDGEDGTLTDKGSGVLEGTVSGVDATATLNNKKDTTAPTGIILNFAPYILLVAFAGVFAVLFLGKKREEF